MKKVEIIKKYEIQPSNILVMAYGVNTSDKNIYLSKRKSKKVSKEIKPGSSFALAKGEYLWLEDEDVVLELSESCNLRFVDIN